MGTVKAINAAAAAYLAGEFVEDDEPVVIVNAAPDAELGRLLDIRIRGTAVSDAEYRQAGETLGLGKRQLQRKLADLLAGRPLASRERFELSSHHKQVILAVKGNVQTAYNRLAAAGEALPSYETFWRRWFDQPTGMQNYARHGAKGIIDFWLYAPYEAPHRTAVFQADHFELPIDVVADGHTTTLVKPWLTLFEDDRTRMIMVGR